MTFACYLSPIYSSLPHYYPRNNDCGFKAALNKYNSIVRIQLHTTSSYLKEHRYNRYIYKINKACPMTTDHYNVLIDHITINPTSL